MLVIIFSSFLSFLLPFLYFVFLNIFHNLQQSMIFYIFQEFVLPDSKGIFRVTFVIEITFDKLLP